MQIITEGKSAKSRFEQEYEKKGFKYPILREQTNYIRQRRIARAKYLLRHTEMSMGEIQAVCGFESPSYFSRAFKAELDTTPSEYRKKR